MSSDKQQGVVKFFNASKGFGFIKPDSGERDIFVHISALNKSNIDELDEGDKVEFDTEPSRKEGKGPQAINLKVLV
jgi:CspA family cold shock protein